MQVDSRGYAPVIGQFVVIKTEYPFLSLSGFMQTVSVGLDGFYIPLLTVYTIV